MGWPKLVLHNTRYTGCMALNAFLYMLAHHRFQIRCDFHHCSQIRHFFPKNFFLKSPNFEYIILSVQLCNNPNFDYIINLDFEYLYKKNFGYIINPNF